MKNILIDTCILISIIRKSSDGQKCIDAIQKIDDNPNLIVSVVSIAELESFALQNNWGEKKPDQIKAIQEKLTCINIDVADKELLTAYAAIDAFSKRKKPDAAGNLLSGSARKMGKNDLWIAATAHALEAPLITTDGDFDHLNNKFLTVLKIV